MTLEEFDNKWEAHLEPGHYGLEINNSEIIDYLDEEFFKEVKINPDFQFSQIKLKFGFARVYSNSNKNDEWEEHIDNILKVPSYTSIKNI